MPKAMSLRILLIMYAESCGAELQDGGKSFSYSTTVVNIPTCRIVCASPTSLLSDGLSAVISTIGRPDSLASQTAGRRLDTAVPEVTRTAQITPARAHPTA